VVLVTVTADQAGAARLLVDDPLPAGFEIENPSLLRAGDLQGIPWLGLLETSAHQEFRAERFVAAVDRQASEPERFQLAYRVRAVTPGRFQHPGRDGGGYVSAPATRLDRGGPGGGCAWPLEGGARAGCFAPGPCSTNISPVR
jgi:hypothetical protein